MAGDEPGWGGEATSWAEGVTKILNNLVGPDDILQTSFNVANNQVIPLDITSLVFNAGSVRSAEITYAIYRISNDNPDGNAESGKIQLLYDNNIGWSLAVGEIVGDAGVQFSVTPSGQFQYTSTDIGFLNYLGVMKFKATALQQ